MLPSKSRGWITAHEPSRHLPDTALEHRRILYAMAQQLLSEGRLGWLGRRELTRFARCLSIDALEAGLIIRAAQANTPLQGPAATQEYCEAHETTLPSLGQVVRPRSTIVYLIASAMILGLFALQWIVSSGR